ncbi:hypothetical protein [Streptomyces sp. cg36]|uniref:hypothetical protein n=1 Tax=Streptomyces sp. cg36 TaxID=3238798 RepID=UPI0034E19864
MPIKFATCSYLEFRPEMGLPVRTTAGEARFIRYRVAGWLDALTPSRWFINKPDAEFTHFMIQKIEEAGVDRIVAQAQAIADHHGQPDATIVLLCFENLKTKAGGDWCHRSLVARYLAEKLGYEIPELGTVAPMPAAAGGSIEPSEPEPEQLSLL